MAMPTYQKMRKISMDFIIPENNIAQFVQSIADEHGVVYVRTALDDFAEKITELSGDDVKPDYTEKLIIALKKKGVIDSKQFVKILSAYLDEKIQHSEKSSDT